MCKYVFTTSLAYAGATFHGGMRAHIGWMLDREGHQYLERVGHALEQPAHIGLVSCANDRGGCQVVVDAKISPLVDLGEEALDVGLENRIRGAVLGRIAPTTLVTNDSDSCPLLTRSVT